MKNNPTVMVPVKRSVHPEQPAPPESEPAASHRKVDQVFLTPRVINAHSYQEMSADLRQLIDRAESITETLQTAYNNAQETAGRMKKASRRYEERLNLGARMFEAMCKRADEVEAVMNKFTDQAASIESNVVNADEHYESFTERMKSWEETAQTLDSRLNGLTSEIRSSAEPTFNHLHELLDRAGKASERAEFAEKQSGEVRRQCDTVRQLMGEEIMVGAGLIDQLSTENEQLQSVLDAGASLTETITKQSAEKQAALEESAMSHIHKIDHEAQRQTGKIKSMKSELVGLIIDLDQRTESLQSIVEQHETLNTIMQNATNYLKQWEPYLPNDREGGEGVPAALREAVERLREIMDDEFDRMRTRLNRLSEAVTLPPDQQPQDNHAKNANHRSAHHDNANGNAISRNDSTVLPTPGAPIVTTKKQRTKPDSPANR